jgi:hypothetical protein
VRSEARGEHGVTQYGHGRRGALGHSRNFYRFFWRWLLDDQASSVMISRVVSIDVDDAGRWLSDNLF